MTAKLTFRYTTMAQGKSIELLRLAHAYENGGKHVLLLTSSLDDRFGKGVIASRIGIQHSAIAIKKKDHIIDIFLRETEKLKKQFDEDAYFSRILIDEAQFFTKEHIRQLAKIVDTFDVPCDCWGLKNDFQNNLFDGSYTLLCLADDIKEVEGVCQFCPEKATMVLRTANGKPTYEGPQIQVGDSEYIPVCRRCYYSPDLSKLKK